MTCSGEIELYRAVNILKAWCVEYKIDINYSKSAVMIVRVDKRTKHPGVNSIMGIPLVDRYTYLGIEFDDSMRFQPMLAKLKGKVKTFQRHLAISNVHKLPRDTQLLMWQALFKSRFTYGIHTVGYFCPGIMNHYKKFLYQSIKILLEIRTNPDQDEVLKIALGIPFIQYWTALVSDQHRVNIATARVVAETDIIDRASAKLRLVTTHEISDLVKASLNCLVNGHNKKQELKCPCTHVITDTHWK